MLTNSSRAFRRISVSAALFCVLLGQTSAFAAAPAGHSAPAAAPGGGGSAAGGGGPPVVVVEDVILQPPSDNLPPRHVQARHKHHRALEVCPLDDPRCHQDELDD
jgi:hypothetical protein